VQFPEFGFILLVTVWGKNDKSDLSAADRSALAALIKGILIEISQRANK
jgi:hypothetical protein